MLKNFSFFCTCPRGFEEALAEELHEITYHSKTLQVHKHVSGGVHCSGEMPDAWLINLYSRIASRILLRIAQGAYKTEDDIYRLAHSQDWSGWFHVENTLRVDITAIKSPLKSLGFTTLRIKDGVVDYFRKRFNKRPSIDTKTPDIHIVGFLEANHVTLYLDTSGEALFKRGWRTEKGDAPLRENLAAGLLRVAGWKPGMVLFDPMCGSGTILIEAAKILSGIPPGMQRRFAFEKFHNFDEKQWQSMKNAIPKPSLPVTPTLFGSDISGEMLAVTRNNLKNAGIQIEIPLKQTEAQEVHPPATTPGIMLTNPPYGERIRMRGDRNIAENNKAAQFYSILGTTLKQRFAGWKIFLFTADFNVPQMLRLKEARKTPFYNGAIECRLFRFDMVAGFNRRQDKIPSAKGK